MSSQYAQLVEKINRIVRDRGDVELMVMLDRIVDQQTEAEQAAALGEVVKILNQGKKPSAKGQAGSGPAPSAAVSTISSAHQQPTDVSRRTTEKQENKGAMGQFSQPDHQGSTEGEGA